MNRFNPLTLQIASKQQVEHVEIDADKTRRPQRYRAPLQFKEPA